MNIDPQFLEAEKLRQKSERLVQFLLLDLEGRFPSAPGKWVESRHGDMTTKQLHLPPFQDSTLGKFCHACRN